MGRCLARLIPFLLLGSLVACGGSSSSSAISVAPDNLGGITAGQVQGIWTGNITVAGNPSSPIFAPIVQGGLAFFFGTNGVLYVLPTFTGASSVNSTLLAFAPTGVTFPNGQAQESFSVTVTVTDVNSASGSTTTPTIKGNFSGNGETGTFTLTQTQPFAGNPSVVPGNWQGFYLGTGSMSVALTVQSGGSFTGNDSNGCALNGSIALLQSDQNLFSVSLDSTGSSSTCFGQMKGLAFESTSDISGLFGGVVGTYYYITASSTSGGAVIELKVQ